MLPTMAVLDPIVARARTGDRDAIDELFRRHREDVTRIAYRFIGPSGDLEDVVQEAFIQLFRSLPAFEGKSKFSTWMYRVVSNVAKMYVRAARARPMLAASEGQQEPREISPNEWPDEVADRHKRLEALYRQLENLSEKKRTVLILHDFEGLSPREIAEIVEAPALTVRTRLFYARKEIYAALANEPTFEELRDAFPGTNQETSR